MRKQQSIAAVLTILGLASCGGNTEQEFKPMKFPYVEAPAMLSDGQKVEFVIAHFWDGIASSVKLYPCDSNLVNGVMRSEVETAMARYAVLVSQLPLAEAQKQMRGFADKIIANEEADTSFNVLETLSSLTEQYFYDPNSPVRDEDIYRPFAARMASCAFFPESRRTAFSTAAADASLNERGSVAADFKFSDRKGTIYSLYGIRSKWTILFFSNPGCHACQEIITALQESEDVQNHIQLGELSILNIYIDEDLGEWYKYMPIYPDNWYNGYDHNHLIRDEHLYDVRAIPSLYLLDRDKVVLMKDVPVEKLMNNLPWNQSNF